MESSETFYGILKKFYLLALQTFNIQKVREYMDLKSNIFDGHSETFCIKWHILF